MMNGNGMGEGFMGFGFFGILILVLIVLIVVWMMKSGSNISHNNSVETLNQRLAKGEISEEEYDRLKKKLNQ
ncbi:SHOCT domain-containing protein [Alkalihalobacillus macyae]|uniref:SHOCT domain-containing protein n=1 Tax=Guptibacillus hwajinpoensis TaxID=208199 RepID=UPI00273B8AE1|nr:SHOCT domain-containing protein [Alkalihalobacillus macyae]MDP4553543.1 SHOCT domain-containing protein [Alkalihalobacillus macyae]